MLNRIILIGRLTKDPEMKRTPSSNVALTSFTLAVDRYYQSSRREKETDFIRIFCWDKLAERCKQHLAKGRLVAVEGRLQIRNYETPQGERRSIAEVLANDVRFLGKSPREADEGIPIDEDAYETMNDFYPEGGKEKQAQASAKPQAGRKDFGKFKEENLDREIDLDDDDPFKEEF